MQLKKSQISRLEIQNFKQYLSTTDNKNRIQKTNNCNEHMAILLIGISIQMPPNVVLLLQFAP